MSAQDVFVDPDGEPLRFFLPMSLPSRHAFKQKIEGHGGVLVQSELMTNIIKIGDPARPHCYDASWLNFRYIDDAIRENELQNPEFYVMMDPVTTLRMVHSDLPVPTTQRATPSSGGLPNGVGSRGTRMEFTPEEDDVLRRIVHRPGVATSGNKIYQLIAQRYGGHSFHSWRDRYIRHMRPIWGAPTEEGAMDVNAVDLAILEQSYLRASHLSPAERAQNPSSAGTAHLSESMGQEETFKLASPGTLKKQRAAFSTTDDEILLKYIADYGETASTFKLLGIKHPHHTWESWKNRVKAVKKKNHGSLPEHQPMGATTTVDSNESLQPKMSVSAKSTQTIKPDLRQQEQHDVVDANIDPSLQSNLQSSIDLHRLIVNDDAQAAFEAQIQQNDYTQDHEVQVQAEVPSEVTADALYDYGPPPRTESLLALQLRAKATPALHMPHQSPSRKRDVSHLSADPGFDRQGTRHININDPTIDEPAAPVSDIEDETQLSSTDRKPKRVTKRRKTNAAAQAAAARAAAVPRMSQAPLTPSRLPEVPSPSDLKSAKQEHHERQRSGLAKAVRAQGDQDFASGVHEPRTRAARARAASQEPQPIMASSYMGSADQWTVVGDNARTAEDFVSNGDSIGQHASRPIGQPERSTNPTRNTKTQLRTMDQLDEEGFLQTDDEQTNDLLPADFAVEAMRSGKPVRQREVLATPGTSPVRLPMSHYKTPTANDQELEFGNGFEPPSPTPDTPNRSFSQSQFLQDTQSIRGDLAAFEFVLNDLGGYEAEDARVPTEAHDSAQNRKAVWVERQARALRIPTQDAEAAWHQTSGVQSLANKVVQAYSEGRSPQRTPGIWTDEDDQIIQSTDAAAIARVDNFHGGQSDVRLLFLQSSNQQMGRSP